MWDWDSAYVQENGHPAVTPLAEAQKSGNLEGWKKNEVTKFESSEGDDPDNDYTDNVIFPSGKTDPYTISDWEWMLEAFDKAISARGWDGDGDAYGISIPFNGYFQTADLVSSFGGATGTYYKDKEGNVSFSGTSDNFKTFVDCMNAWYENGWMDTKFETRSGDMFFSINESGFTQGKVGMWLGTVGTVGQTIRPTCQNEEDKEDAYVMGCALPINDVYGTDAQKFGFTDGLYHVEEIDGVKTYVSHIDPTSGIDGNAFKTTRMIQRYDKTGHGDVDYAVDKGNTMVVQQAEDAYGTYVNTGSMTGYSGKFNEEESDLDGDTWTKINDYMNIEVPKMVKNGTDNWNAYVEGLNKYEPEKVVEIYQKYVDEALGK